MASRDALHQRTLQACNACKRRKVRCNGLVPCQQCQHHSIQCIYLAAPVAARGRSRLGAAQRGTVITESKRQKTMDPIPTSPPRPASARPSTYDANFFLDLVPEYLKRVYPVTPILGMAEVYHNIDIMGSDDDAAALTYACAGVTLLLMQNDKPWAPGCYAQASEMIDLSINHHKPLRLDSRPTLTRILSRVFLEMCLLMLHKNELAFFYLHEAISLMLMRGLGNFLSSEVENSQERARRERIYWVCFIHERHLALEAKTVVYLDALPSLPDVTGTASGSIERGWNYILQTFLVIDKGFVKFWIGERSSVTAEWILKKHEELTDDLWQLEVSTLPITQQADLIITRQWLQTLTWEMAMSNVLLSSKADESGGLSLLLPLQLSRELKGFLTQVSTEAVEIHGIGIIEKLFEITTTIADIVLALTPDNYAEAASRVHDVLFMKEFLLGLPHVKDIQREIIDDKMRQIELLHSESLSRYQGKPIDVEP